MTHVPFWRFRGLVAIAVLLPFLTLGGNAKAQPNEDASGASLEPSGAPRKTGPSPATGTTEANAPASAPFFQHLGPDTFPGHLRGLYGGSLWLEPSFDGLQWPQNPYTGVGFSGSVWVDNGYESITRNLAQLPNSSMYFQQGQALLRITPAYVHGRFFVQGQTELVGNLCQAANNGDAANEVANTVCLSTGTFTTDDLWMRVGEWNRWDVKVGRFEAWEIYHLGMGMDPYTLERLGAGMFGMSSNTTPALEVPTLYGVNYLHDRPSDGLATGYAALHVYWTDSFRTEFLGKLGNDNYRSDNATGNTPSNYLGGRFAAILDLGWFKLKGGADYQKITPTTQTIEPGTPVHKKDAAAAIIQKGVGGSVQFIIDPIVEFGLNAAIGLQKQTDGFGREVPERTYTTKSIGGFANLRLAEGWLAGTGINWTTQLDSFKADNSNADDYTSQLQGFTALQYMLGGQFFVKAVLAYARADFQPSDISSAVWKNSMLSGRIRLMYLY